MEDEYFRLEAFVSAWMHTPNALSLSATTRWFVRELFYIAASGRRSVTVNGNTMVIVVDSGHLYIAEQCGRNESAIKMRIRVAKKCGILTTERRMGMVGLIVVELCIPSGCEHLLEAKK